MYLGSPCCGYALDCHIVYLAIPETRPLCMKRQYLFVLFICNCKKMKFKFVQINMKHVSYMLSFLLVLDVNFGLKFYQRHYFVYASSEGSCDTVLLCRLVSAFASSIMQ